MNNNNKIMSFWHLQRVLSCSPVRYQIAPVLEGKMLSRLLLNLFSASLPFFLKLHCFYADSFNHYCYLFSAKNECPIYT